MSLGVVTKLVTQFSTVRCPQWEHCCIKPRVRRMVTVLVVTGLFLIFDSGGGINLLQQHAQEITRFG